MDRLTYILAVTLFLSFHPIAVAQNRQSVDQLNAIDKTINESIFITTNTATLLTGETLYYKLFCIDKNSNAPSNHSKIAYIELIDATKKVVFSHKLFLKNGTENGDFFIPTTLETGNYQLIGYTSWMLNESKPVFFNTAISIINPYQVSGKKENSSAEITRGEEVKKESMEEISTEMNQNPFVTAFSKKKYTHREIVNIGVNSKSGQLLKGNYAVSVRKKDDLLLHNAIRFESNPNTNVSFQNDISNANLVLPELRGEIISGSITSKLSTDNVENKIVALSIPGKNFIFKISKTDKNGHFIFNLENKNTSANVVIQLTDSDKENFSIQIDTPKPIDYSTLSFDDLKLNSAFKKSIEDRAVASQIENAYYDTKKDSVLSVSNTTRFFDPNFQEFKLDDYTRFPTLKETVIEIIEGTYFTKTRENYTLHIKDYIATGELGQPALVLVDGLLIEDLNELFEYPTKNIYKITVVRGAYYYGSKIFNGIISFTTKNDDYSSNLKGSFLIKPEVKRPLAKKEYFQPDYSSAAKSNRIPDYRYQLLWMPETKLDQKENTLSFYTSDISGIFEIIIQGFTDSGIPVLLKETFEVE